MTPLRMGICRAAGRTLARVFVWTGLMALAAPASAQVTPAAGYVPPDDTQAIRLGAVIFYDYTYQKEPKITDTAGNLISPSAFNVARTYINVTGNISHVVAFRITPDITRETFTGPALSGSLVFRLKYGYAQFNLDDWLWRGSFVRMGIQQTPFIDYEESVYRYRFQGTVQAERDGGMSSADAGVSFRTLFPRNYGEVYLGLYNGEGYQQRDPNDQKAFLIRGTVRPLPEAGAILRNIRLTAFYFGDHYVKDAVRERFIFNTIFEHKYFNVGFDWMTRTDQQLPTNSEVDSDGYSFWVTPFFKEKGNGPEALIRVDGFKPNSDLDGRQTRVIVGGAYWFPHPGGNATAAILVDWEQVTTDNFPAPVPARQQRYFVHGLISF
jgi:hypothetical protein